MNNTTPEPCRPAYGVDVITVGFATAVAMWAVGYVTHIPGFAVPGALAASLLAAVLIAGGLYAGITTQRGGRGGAMAGLITGALNLLIVGSMMNIDRTGNNSSAAWAWVPATLILTAGVMGLAAMAGQGLRRATVHGERHTPVNWTFRFVMVTVAATGLLLVAGGLVTGREAGLAVPDWPGSFGYNMFLYPLAKMTGGRFYEHAHRLYGALVGVTTFALAVHLWLADRRGWMKWLATVAVIAVVVQGVLGGLRVALAHTGDGIEVAAAEHETAISTLLRVAHGVFGQVFLGLLILLACAVSDIWRDRRAMISHPAAATDRPITMALVILLLLQLLLGAVVRHLHVMVMLHITAAALVVLLVLAVAMRLWVFYTERLPIFHTLAVGLVVLTVVQIALGIAALVVTGTGSATAQPTTADALLTTAHQGVGAALLAVAVAICVMIHRLVHPQPREVPCPA